MEKSASKLEFIELNSLVPYSENSRTHSEEQISQIEKSIQRFAFTNPILIDEKNGIIAGHGRFVAAANIGLDKAPCLRLSYLTEDEKKAYVIADNKIALNAGWDEEKLAEQLIELRDSDFELDLLGFDVEELGDLLPDFENKKELNNEREDKIPEIRENQFGVKRGDLWLLGVYLECDKCGVKENYDKSKVDDICGACNA